MRSYNKVYYNKQHKTPTKYKPRVCVLIRDSTVHPDEDRKLKTAYKGVYQIAKTLDKNRYVVTDIPGFNVTQLPYNSILSPNKLKLWQLVAP